MKIFFKVIYYLLGIFLCFIIINLVIGTIKYGGITNYSRILNEKDWQSSVDKISISKPNTWLSVFYADKVEQSTGNIKTENLATNGDKIETVNTETKETNHNPYDPDYEDEFNSFFGGNSRNTGEIIPVQDIENIEDLGEAGFKIDE